MSPTSLSHTMLVLLSRLPSPCYCSASLPVASACHWIVLTRCSLAAVVLSVSVADRIVRSGSGLASLVIPLEAFVWRYRWAMPAVPPATEEEADAGAVTML